GEARTVGIRVRVPLDVARLDWDVAAKSGAAGDRVRVSQKVIAVHPVRVYQATLAQLDKPLVFPVERPADAVPGRGGVRVEVMSTLAGGLAPRYGFFARYPSACYEPRAARAAVHADVAVGKALMAHLAAATDGDRRAE